ncbi:MAG: hydrogenase expression/formation protein HypE [Myxococcales bacterium]|nr:MAG: hydrogenase expression/formation protein HypE [Myxococcales bacterium]
MFSMTNSANLVDAARAPLAFGGTERVLLSHGSGGSASRELLEEILLPALGLWGREPVEEQAVLAPISGRPALTTDSFVVSPLFYPGGDIGRLSVFGTVNDLAVGGAIPRDLALSFILEEGLPMPTLVQIARSVARACAEARVRLVTGDTKVVERGKAEGLYITTTAVGTLAAGVDLSVRRARPGDAVLVSGALGEHGAAVLAEREGLRSDGLASDAAPLYGLVQSMLAVEPRIRCFRDPTRGGLASALTTIACASSAVIRIERSRIPVSPAVERVCETLEVDPLSVASEGRVVAVVPPESVERLLHVMHSHPLGRDAALVGQVMVGRPGSVIVHGPGGVDHEVGELVGERMSRVC